MSLSKKITIALLVTMSMVLAFALCGCGSKSVKSVSEPVASPDWVSGLPQAASANQLFVVAGVGKTTAYVSMHQKDEEGNWLQIMSTPGYIGKKGLGKTKEGDGKTPAGVFKFNKAFGIEDDPGCSIKYQKVTEDDYWSGDVREGYEYNKMVSIKDYADLDTENSEHIMDYNVHYRYVLNINYNEDGVAGKGSAIFLHCLGPEKPYTGGCVAIPENQMITVMTNVDPECVVVIDEMSKLCPEMWEAWGL